LTNKSFNHILIIAVGALVMFTNNIAIQKGVVNGAIATITSIIFDLKNNVVAIKVQLTTNSIKMILKKHKFQDKYKYDAYYYNLYINSFGLSVCDRAWEGGFVFSRAQRCRQDGGSGF
jgi:hypothetical protein